MVTVVCYFCGQLIPDDMVFQSGDVPSYETSDGSVRLFPWASFQSHCVSEKCLLFWLKIPDVVDSLGCITWTMMCWSTPQPLACLPRPNSWPSSVGLARVGKDTEGQWSAAQDCGYTSWCYWNCEFLPPSMGSMQSVVILMTRCLPLDYFLIYSITLMDISDI